MRRLVMARVSVFVLCLFFVFFHIVCSSHCGDLEVAPLSFVMCVSQDKTPNEGKHSFLT